MAPDGSQILPTGKRGYIMFCRRTFLLLSLCGFVALTLTGCGLANFNNRFSAEETERKSFTTKGSPRVIADTFNGAIEVTTGALDTVNASVIKRATGSSQDAADDDLDTIEV